jgi:spermidine synthase
VISREEIHSADSGAPDALHQLRVDRDEEPFLIDDGGHRAMCFTTDGNIQSEMRIDNPNALVSEYTRKMMAFLLFRPRPRHVLMVGLGGGSLLKYCRLHLPTTRFTAIEINANVIALRSHFQIPPDGSGLRVIHADGALYLAELSRSDERADVILVDAYDRSGIARSVAQVKFLENARRVLTDRGVFVMNLAVDGAECATYLGMIRSVFGEPVIPVTVGWGGNTVAFAGPALWDRRCLAVAPRRALRVRERLDLSFSRLPGLLRAYLGSSQTAEADSAIG